jgi:hypothetical protein
MYGRLPYRRHQAQLDVYSGEAALFSIHRAGVLLRAQVSGLRVLLV